MSLGPAVSQLILKIHIKNIKNETCPHLKNWNISGGCEFDGLPAFTPFYNDLLLIWGDPVPALTNEM